MSKQQAYQVQIQGTVVVSKSIKAASFEEALEIAKLMAQREEGAQAAKGWAYEWGENFQVKGVFQ